MNALLSLTGEDVAGIVGIATIVMFMMWLTYIAAMHGHPLPGMDEIEENRNNKENE